MGISLNRVDRRQYLRGIGSALAALMLGSLLTSTARGQQDSQTVVYPINGSHTEVLAAKEVRRYIFLRTGVAPTLVAADSYSNLPDGDVIVVSNGGRAIIAELKQHYGNVDPPISGNRKGYLIKSIKKDGRDILVIAGADTVTTLNAAYRFAELLGCYFNLAGDVIPDRRLPLPLKLSLIHI